MLDEQHCEEQQQVYESNDAWLSTPPCKAQNVIHDNVCLQATTASAVIIFVAANYSV